MGCFLKKTLVAMPLLSSLLRVCKKAPSHTTIRRCMSSQYVGDSVFLRTLHERGLVHQATDMTRLDQTLTKNKSHKGAVAAYLGFDATAPSLHVGSLLPLVVLRHLQRSGHKPIVLVGGATTRIGDPSGKDQARKMLSDSEIDANIHGISTVFKKFLTFGDGPTDAVLVNNLDWLGNVQMIDFLREYGPHFTINRMLTQDSVRLRLEREQPLTLLEFNYMVLQALDFLHLRRQYGALVQLGGSDQWGNIVAGVELCRRVDREQAFGLTTPLLTTADGRKMGKTESGAVWLSEDLLSPFDFWQFWRNAADADVQKFLGMFTDIPMSDVQGLAAAATNGMQQGSAVAINEAKVRLADEVTSLLHGRDSLVKIHRSISELKLGQHNNNDDENVDGGATTETHVKEQNVREGEVQVCAVVVELRMASSKAEARRLISGGGVKVNGIALTSPAQNVTLDMFAGKDTLKLAVGKKRFGVVRLARD
eukprot:c6530_g1_i1.p1 GENE.c6530_g1_i1~~c6530_g1_i1.p1  ORF type:complete len:479 (+),score=133.20 c6530_g1_i1:1-1437(+)